MSLKTKPICQKRMFIPLGLFLQWHITKHCNFRYAHCYQKDYSDEELRFRNLFKSMHLPGGSRE
jgi:MoaA/NifB/PqqE/SkfB family radical SAM enzyme